MRATRRTGRAACGAIGDALARPAGSHADLVRVGALALASRVLRLWCVVCVAGVAAVALAPQFARAADDPVGRVVELTNAERQKQGLGPLAPQPSIARAAQAYAAVLAGSDCFAHTCGPVPDFVRRATDAGYSGWSVLGENIAGGQLTPEAVVAAWMASPGHRDNILNPMFDEIGVGRSTGGRYGVYWAQVFGARRAQPAPVPALAAAAAQPGAADARGSDPAGALPVDDQRTVRPGSELRPLEPSTEELNQSPGASLLAGGSSPASADGRAAPAPA